MEFPMPLLRCSSYFYLIVLCMSLTACGGGSSSDAPATSAPSLDAYVVKGPVDGAECQLFNDLGEAVSDVAISDSGRVRLTNIQGEAPFELRCEGGNYIDEATGLNVAASGMVLRTRLNGLDPVTLSPLTELAYRLALTDGNLDDFSDFLEDIADEFGLDGDDLLNILPTDTMLNIPDVDTAAGRYGLMLAGLAQMMNDKGLGHRQFFSLLQESMADGTLSNSGDVSGTDLRQALINLANSSTGSGGNVTVSLVATLETKLGESGDGGPQAKMDQVALSFAEISLEKIWGDAGFTNAVLGGSGAGALSYSSSDDGVANVDGSGEVTLVRSGSATITVTKAADDRYLERSNSFSLTVNKAQQTPLSFAGSGYLTTWGSVPFTNALSGGSGDGLVTYSSSDESVATVDSSGEVTLVSSGSASISAVKAADDRYVLTASNYNLIVNKANQSSLSFADTSLVKTWGDAAFTNVLSGGSGSGLVTYSSNDESVVTVDSNGEITLVGTGPVTVTATKAADARYLLRDTSFSLTVNKAAQSTLLVSSNTLTHTVNDTLPNPVSGGAGTGALIFESNDTSVVNFVLSDTGTVVGAGEASITVYRASNDYYLASSSVQYSVVGLAKPSFSLASSDLADVAIGSVSLSSIEQNASGYVFDDDGVPVLNYRLVGAPFDSALAETDASEGSLALDVAGRYVVAVELSDGVAAHEPSDAYFVNIDTVGYTGSNPLDNLPVANGGNDLREVAMGVAVELDGSHSAVTKGSITYLWEVVAAPSGSSATFDSTTLALVNITPDLDGVYIVKLTVSDGSDSSVDILHLYTVGATTQVVGNIDVDTSWTLASSPYELTGDLNVTAVLTIEAGVVVLGNDNRVGLDTAAALLDVNGTGALPVAFSNFHINAKYNAQPDIQIENVFWRGGSFCHLQGDNSYRGCEGGLTITDSVLLGSTSPEQYGQWTEIWYPKRPVNIEGNILSDWHDIGAGIDGRNNTTNRFFLRSNVMHTLKPAKYSGFDISMWANYGETAKVNYNTLIDTTVGGQSGYGALFDAKHNYFPDREISTIKNADATVLPFATAESGDVPDHRKYTPYDADSDGVDDKVDNCASVSNVNQTDSNDDGVGDACTFDVN